MSYDKIYFWPCVLPEGELRKIEAALIHILEPEYNKRKHSLDGGMSVDDVINMVMTNGR